MTHDNTFRDRTARVTGEASGIANPVLNKVFRLTGRAEGDTLSLDLDNIRKLSVSDSTFAPDSPGILLAPNAAKASRAENFSALVP